ncbi:MAG: branched-chain amino acid ABC transporter permease [Nitrospiraceae bacterium]|nr:branched-chain amino acid ABC transporter permease [Nitrospiraceae bacterium]MDA8207613.1 branched-chain amino acid ABC transporter permease [Actinomycetota bacterium]
MLEAIGFGLVTAAVVALAAVGLALQVSVTNFINFAYGDFMTFGAYSAYAANSAGLNFFAAVVVGGVATALLGVLANLAVFRPFVRRKARVITLLISTIGLSFIVQNAIVIIWGTGAERYTVSIGNAHRVGPFLWTTGDLVIMGTAFVLLFGLHLMLRYTRFGKSLRATSNNPELALASGIDTGRVVNYTWLIAGFFAAVAGVALAMELNTLRPVLGFNELFVVFGAIILGGIGRPYGAMLGALIIGILTEVSGAYLNPAYKGSIAFAVVVILLLVRPQGLLAAKGKSA